MLVQRLGRALAKPVVVQIGARRADDARFRRHLPVAEPVVQRRQQLAQRQVAGGAEHHAVERRNRNDLDRHVVLRYLRHGARRRTIHRCDRSKSWLARLRAPRQVRLREPLHHGAGAAVHVDRGARGEARQIGAQEARHRGEFLGLADAARSARWRPSWHGIPRTARWSPRVAWRRTCWSESISPTSMPFTRMPCGAPSPASIFISAMPAARDTAVGAPFARGALAPRFSTLMMRPHLRSFMPGHTRRHRRIAPNSFSSRSSCQISSVILLGRHGARGAGVVDQDIDLAERLDHVGECLLDVIGLRHVAD